MTKRQLQHTHTTSMDPKGMPVSGARFEWVGLHHAVPRTAHRATAALDPYCQNDVAATFAANIMLQRARLVSSEPLVVNVSSNGAFLGEVSRDRCACSRLAVPAYRLLDSKSSGRTIPTLRPTSSTKSRGLQHCGTDTLQSHSVHARLPRSQLRPQKKPYVNVPPLHLHTGNAGH